jgi:hypothetical protein
VYGFSDGHDGMLSWDIAADGTMTDNPRLETGLFQTFSRAVSATVRADGSILIVGASVGEEGIPTLVDVPSQHVLIGTPGGTLRSIGVIRPRLYAAIVPVGDSCHVLGGSYWDAVEEESSETILSVHERVSEGKARVALEMMPSSKCQHSACLGADGLLYVGGGDIDDTTPEWSNMVAYSQTGE